MFLLKALLLFPFYMYGDYVDLV
uniref:Uncharacterized protein n=1 Tax=Anguilla anguilla TaxID=7936 RepID=A0A0E9SDM1_ANGAN